MNPEMEFFIAFTRRWWLDIGYAHPLFSPFMEFPDRFANSLFDETEAFLSPCTFNPIWNGGCVGEWSPMIGLMNGPMPEE